MAFMKQHLLQVTVLLFMFVCCVISEEQRNCDVADKSGLPNDVCSFDLRMRGAHPKKNDQYFCAGYHVAKDVLGDQTNHFAEGYIVKYEAIADANTAHHILVFGCSKLRASSSDVWNCGQVCDSGEQIIFAWAKNAPPLTLPHGVGQHIGGRTTEINHIVIQIHYVNPLPAPDYSGIRLFITKQRQPFISGIYLLLSYGVDIPADTKKFHVDSSCVFNWADSIVPFGYRTHAHSLGSVISGYKVNRGGEAQLIGKGNPQWPQAFYPVKDHFEIRPGDLLAARCTYNSTGRFRVTQIGSTSNDEMCNFYIMYYMNSTMEYRKGEDTCFKNQAAQVFPYLPRDNDEPLPSNPALEEMAHGHHHHHMGGGTDNNEGTTVTNLIDEPKVDVEKPLIDDNKINNGMNNRLFQTGLRSQGKKQLSTSMGTSLPDNPYRDIGTGYNDVRKPPSYIMDYPALNDYYDILQQRSRNRLKKPYYDLYDNQLLDYSDFAKKPLSSLSRNRNKLFNDKYEEYAAGDVTKSSQLERDGVSSKFDTQSRNKVAMATQNENQSDVTLQSPDRPSEGMNIKAELGMKFISSMGDVEIGQVGGLAVNPNGDLYIFHRGSKIWDSWSFNGDNVYMQQNRPVTEDTIVILNKDGQVLRHFGRNSYFLPHGMSLDSHDNIWLTDVALHQVFRIPKGSTSPDMTLGIRFEPGTDKYHFCKPSDVAVMSTGEFFVSDGYCNSRVMKFDKNGYFIKQWGTQSMSQKDSISPPPGSFNLPHSVTLAEDKHLLCVADRENGRIQCFDYEGKFVRQMNPKLFGSALYAVEYCPNHGGILFAVNGPVFGKNSVDTQGFTLDINNGDVLSVWNIPGSTLTHPHDVTVDSTDHLVYVGELNPRKVWKFQMSQALYTSANISTLEKVPSGEKNKPTPSSEVTKGVSKETSMLNVVKVTSAVSPSSSNIVNTMHTVTVNKTPSTTVDIKTTDKASTVVNTVPSTSKSHQHVTGLDATSVHTTFENNPVTVVNLVQSTAGKTEPSTFVKPVQSNVGSKVPPTVVNPAQSVAANSEAPIVVKPPPSIVKQPTVINLSNARPSKIKIEENSETIILKKTEVEAESIGPSVIIGTMLVVPVLLLIIITVTVRLYRNGHFRNCGRRSSKKSVFSLGNFLHSHKGFDRLSTEDDDHDFDNALDDSDNEEFNITRKA